MKAPAFNYQRPSTLDEALALLHEYGAEAQILAGGQSLMPMLAMRLSRPSVLIDINRIRELSGIERRDGHVRIGALTRYVELERSVAVQNTLALVAKALPHVAHVAVRNRGTIGGSLALADPAAEMPACALASDAHIVLASTQGTRTVNASDYFLGLYETARAPHELLVDVLFPTPQDGEVVAFAELSRRHGDFALVGVAGRLRLVDGRIVDPRIVIFGCTDRPILAAAVGAALAGCGPDTLCISAASQAVADDIEPIDTVHASGDYKLRMTQVLVRRAITAALGTAERVV